MSIEITANINGELTATQDGELLVPASESEAREQLLDKVIYITERAQRSYTPNITAREMVNSILSQFRAMRGEE